MPAVLLWAPIARLPFLTASTLFNAGTAGVFVMAVTRRGLIRAWVCGSIPFMFAMRFGQWSPLLCAACVYPWLSGLLVAKPNIGLPLFLARVRWRSVGLCTLAVVLPTIFAPWWVGSWFFNVRSQMGQLTPHPVPLTMFAGTGVLLLAACLKWRRPEARLLVAMACVPQLPYWADQLPLLLIPVHRREVIGTVVVTLLGFTAWMLYALGRGDFVDTIRPFAILCTYGPALAVVLRRPNTGEMPDWFEAMVARHLPDRLRGRNEQTPGKDEPGI